MRTSAASVRPMDGPGGEGAATLAVDCVAGTQPDVKPVSADGLCRLASAARWPSKWSGIMPMLRTAELTVCSTSPDLVGITMRSAYW